MHSLLTKLFEKRGIKDATELSDEEKKVFEGWNYILSEGELTVDKIKEFCQLQVDLIESKWNDFDTSNDRKAELIPYHSVYRTIITAIGSTKVAREALERQLTELTK